MWGGGVRKYVFVSSSVVFCLLQSCSVLVAEVTQVSLGVGYEIGRAVSMNKRTLCLYRPQPNKSELMLYSISLVRSLPSFLFNTELQLFLSSNECINIDNCIPLFSILQ